MKAYQDSEETPGKSQELYCILCRYIQKYLDNTFSTYTAINFDKPVFTN